MFNNAETDFLRWIYYHLAIPFFGRFPVIHLFKVFSYFAKWRKEHTGKFQVVNSREELYSAVLGRYADQNIDLLEFGVFRGDSLKKFLNLNKDDNSRFFGFDTFTGLPETWNDLTRKVPAGTFNTYGKLPNIGDTRVVFIKGKFEDTLPGFLEKFKSEGHLIIHIDSDLYSSAKFVLESCDHLLTKNCVIIFDEFYSLENEFLALHEYCAISDKKYKVICGTKNYVQIAIIFE